MSVVTRGPERFENRRAPLALIAVLYSLAFGVVNPVIPLFAIAAGGGAAVIGVAAVVGTGTNAFLRPMLGRVGDRWNRHALISVAMLPSLLGIGLLTVRPPVWAIVASYFLVGVGAALLWPALKATAIVESKRAPQSALGRIMSWQGAGLATGQALGGFILGWVGFRATFGISSSILGAGVLVAFCCLRVRRGAVQQQSGQMRATEENVSDSVQATEGLRGQLTAAVVVMLLIGLTISSFLPYVAVYLRYQLHQSADLVGLTIAMFSAAQVIAGYLAQQVSAWLRQVMANKFIVPSLLAVASLLLVGESGTSYVKFVILGMFAAFVFMILNVAITASVSRFGHARLGGRVGLLEGGSLAGAMLGPVIGGVVYSHDRGLLFVVAACIAAIAMAVGALLPVPELLPHDS